MLSKHKVIQVYSVVVCVVAVITFIIGTTGLVSSLIDKRDPLRSGRYALNLTSFENFKMETLKTSVKEQAYIPDDATLNKMYESAREEMLLNAEHRINRSVFVASMSMGLALILFSAHWIILLRISRK